MIVTVLGFEVEADYINEEDLERYADFLLEKGLLGQEDYDLASNNSFSNVEDIAENIEQLYNMIIKKIDIPEHIRERIVVRFSYAADLNYEDDKGCIYFAPKYEWEFSSQDIEITIDDALESLNKIKSFIENEDVLVEYI